ncbi:hypothetical protein [Niabella beijingensis]|uniref:hypothetical protein n=1 Tax=Niabella beijingensis TaxID=2872700 RepID=UPI001CBB343F|nr:hypothetical protein [Niabella beijingensis]MBZ4192650.1 hypothetical protein [Niabella beijingensis]
MKSKQTLFFAVLEDVTQILQDIEATIDIHYYKAGLLDTRDIPAYNSIFDAPNVGIALSGDWNHIDRYLVLKETAQLSIREIPQRAGGEKYSVDQMNNSQSIELKLGGILTTKRGVIVAGRVGTISEDSGPNELYKLFSGKIKKHFKRIGAFYVGKIAEEKLREGWRLVTNEKSPKEYDLAFEY